MSETKKIAAQQQMPPAEGALNGRLISLNGSFMEIYECGMMMMMMMPVHSRCTNTNVFFRLMPLLA